MAETVKKLVTLDGLTLFKSKMDEAIDAKIEGVTPVDVTYATDDEILALFADTPSGSA